MACCTPYPFFESGKTCRAQDCGALTHFGVSRDGLSRFLSSLASGYHDNAYHNFPHAVMASRAGLAAFNAAACGLWLVACSW